ncbi:hypothetical protein ACP70R_009411 [Stipagrostis hirtigluma subsp. patula]
MEETLVGNGTLYSSTRSSEASHGTTSLRRPLSWR